jgi:hypothetical protein
MDRDVLLAVALAVVVWVIDHFLREIGDGLAWAILVLTAGHR